MQQLIHIDEIAVICTDKKWTTDAFVIVIVRMLLRLLYTKSSRRRSEKKYILEADLVNIRNTIASTCPFLVVQKNFYSRCVRIV